jgi:hypothetical protein
LAEVSVNHQAFLGMHQASLFERERYKYILTNCAARESPGVNTITLSVKMRAHKVA